MHILNTFNSFDSQIQFTVDQFPNNDMHFLDIQILLNCATFGIKCYELRQHACRTFS